MNAQLLTNPPVPHETHYQIYKDVERQLKSYLASILADLKHDFFIAGMRVAYDELDSGNEPDVFPYTIEFGFLDTVDAAMKNCEGVDLSLDEIKSSMQKNNISIEQLDDLFACAKRGLEGATQDAELKVCLAFVLAGSPTETYGVSCSCSSKRKYYCGVSVLTSKPSCYCSTSSC
jgi:hypothetical protein